jgi:hypothetical protein
LCDISQFKEKNNDEKTDFTHDFGILSALERMRETGDCGIDHLRHHPGN